MPSSNVDARRLLFAAGLLSLVACAEIASDDPGAESSTADEGSAPSAADGIAARQDALFGSNSCQNADIRIVNSLNFPITVRSIDYFNFTENRWQHENLSNKLVVPGAMEFWTPSFANTDNDEITSFDVNFDHDEDAAGNPIATHSHDHHIDTPDQRCATGRVYLLEIQ